MLRSFVVLLDLAGFVWSPMLFFAFIALCIFARKMLLFVICRKLSRNVEVRLRSVGDRDTGCIGSQSSGQQKCHSADKGLGLSSCRRNRGSVQKVSQRAGRRTNGLSAAQGGARTAHAAGQTGRRWLCHTHRGPWRGTRFFQICLYKIASSG